jgi:electron transport complex protein RnfD
LFEYLWCLALQKPQTIGDLSSAVSGLILALCLPPTAPLWLPIVGSLFMIIIVKMLFGGLGQNIINPASCARVFLLIAFPALVSGYVAPRTNLPIINTADVITTATPLAMEEKYETTSATTSASQNADNNGDDTKPDYLTLYLGAHAGCIGETSILAILIGFLYLLYRRVISFHIPVFYIATVAIFSILMGKDAVYQILSGSLVFGAVYMATDYVTSPILNIGEIIYAIGLGVLTCVIRFFAAYPEGVSFAIIFMNILVPFIDRINRPRFGKLGRKEEANA